MEIVQGQHFGDASSISNIQRLIIENESTTFDIKYDFWKRWLIHEAVDFSESQIELRTRSRYVQNLNELADAESQSYLRQSAENFGKDSIIYNKFDDEAAK